MFTATQCGVMGSRQTSTFHFYFVCVHTSLKLLTLTEIKKKALFYIVIVCWSKSWTGGHWVVHTQCFFFFFLSLHISMMYVFICVYVFSRIVYMSCMYVSCVVCVSRNHFTLLHCCFSPHVFQKPGKKGSVFLSCAFSRRCDTQSSHYAMHIFKYLSSARFIDLYFAPAFYRHLFYTDPVITSMKFKLNSRNR